MTKTRTSFAEWFGAATGSQPFPYQAVFANADDLPELLEVPTGAGKTAAVILGWLWRRRLHPDEKTRRQTPRRLVYCLPMRTLVEQTASLARTWVDRAGLGDEVGVHVLMGGSIDDRWQDAPDRDVILVGTQDQLVSRALNRGYAMSRYRWPIDFALLNNDVLWVLDEVQLMGASLGTSLQLHAFRQNLGSYGPARSLWMSATVDESLLRTVDLPEGPRAVLRLTTPDRGSEVLKQRLTARKILSQASGRITGKIASDGDTLAVLAVDHHEPGTLTLVVCNRVDRAQAAYDAVASRAPDLPRLLVHARYRAAERTSLNERLRTPGLHGIVVATQAVEAGLDISARVLVTELAPWASMVQRFGRCNRYGETEGTVVWVDVDAGQCAPYEDEDLSAARDILRTLHAVGPDALQAVPAPPQAGGGLLPRRRDLLELFDTSTDLAGHDIDVSPYVRDSRDTSVAVAWRRWDGKQPPPDMAAVRGEELCQVPIWALATLLKRAKAWTWDPVEGVWHAVERWQLHPGLTVLLHCDEGGYAEDRGFTGDRHDHPEPVPVAPSIPDEDDADPWTTVGTYVTLKLHASDAAEAAKELVDHLPDMELPSAVLIRAARWHDLGKAHPAFQEMLLRPLDDTDPRRDQGPWAKSDHHSRIEAARRHFRHELVSALVALREGEPFEVAYLAAAHHGKVRMMLGPRPGERGPGDARVFALGVWDHDRIGVVDLGGSVTVPAGEVSLGCMALGGTDGEPSWMTQASGLLDHYGPFRLAFLEMLVRIADWRATRKRLVTPEVTDV